jgi:Tfp pilus assembly protein FimT
VTRKENASALGGRRAGLGAARGEGFTLWETALVLAVLAVTLILAAPALTDFGEKKAETSASALLSLLREARRLAIERNATVRLQLDPLTGRFRIDTTGVGGVGEAASGTVELPGATTLVTELARLQFLFRPGGAAFADSVLVRSADGALLVTVDSWSGVARAEPR